jgi:flagellar motor switch protein FliN/FliY
MSDDQVLSQDDIDKLMSEDGDLEQDWDDDFGDSNASAGAGQQQQQQQPQQQQQQQQAESHSFDQLPRTASQEQAAQALGDNRQQSLDFILDIPLEVSVELGRTKMVINDLLQLGQGSVVELTKLAGEPLEIMVNNKLVARGEVVVVNEKFGVRVTDIVSPMERVKSLH